MLLLEVIFVYGKYNCLKPKISELNLKGVCLYTKVLVSGHSPGNWPLKMQNMGWKPIRRASLGPSQAAHSFPLQSKVEGPGIGEL